MSRLIKNVSSKIAINVFYFFFSTPVFALLGSFPNESIRIMQLSFFTL